jgi:hypothetical protein
MSDAAAAALARADRARANGALSRGPASPEGKARAAANARGQGFRSSGFWLLPDEDGAAFEALCRRQTAELGAVGEAQGALVLELVQAVWKQARADRLEAVLLDDIFTAESAGERLKLVRSLGTLVRYRNALLKDHGRALRRLGELQAQARERPPEKPDVAPDTAPAAPEAARAAVPPGARTNEPTNHHAAPPTPPRAEPDRPRNRQERRRRAALERQKQRRAA